MSFEIVVNTRKIRPRIGEVIRVLNRGIVKDTPLEGYIGFGTPRVVLHPDTLEPWLLFTAWNDVNGQAREIWTTPIKDEETLELDLSKAKKIATGADVGVDGLNTVDPLYDDYNEEWILYATVYPNQSNVAKIVTDKDFNKKSAGLISTNVEPNDCGLPLVRGSDSKALGTIAVGDKIHYVVLDDPYNPSSISIDTSFNAIGTSACRGIDVHKLFTINGRLMMLSELTDFVKLWHIRLFIGPDKDWYFVGTHDMRGKYLMPVSHVNPIPHTHDYDIGNVGHPEFSTELKRPVLMWAAFRNWNRGGNLAWAHDILAAFVDPFIFSDYKLWLPANFVGGNDELGKPLFTLGARKAVLYVKTSNTGTITILQSSSPHHIANDTGIYVSDDYSISSAGVTKIVVEDPLPYIAVKASMTIDEWGIYLLP